MAEFTKERLTQIVRAIDSEAYDEAEIMAWFNSDDIMTMARQLLAGLEQEPVAWPNHCDSTIPAALRFLAEKPRPIYGNSPCNTEHLYQLAREIEAMARRPLYAAPQLPQPAVPDEIQKLKDGRGFKYVKDGVHYSVNYANGWNQCRAAMLQGDAQPQNAQQNIPENIPTLREGVAAIRNSGIAIDAEKIQAERDALNEPVQGWIPCSERMPDADGNYWGWWSESKRQGPVWFIKSELQAQFQSSEITHWMPLPACPKGE